MLGMNDIKVGVVIVQNGEPFEVLSANHLKIAQRRPVMQTKIKSLKTGKVLSHTFQQSDKIPAAEVSKLSAVFKYRTRDEFFFVGDDGKKLGFSEAELGNKINYLKKDLVVKILLFEGSPLSLELPVKVVLEVKQSPPGERGDTAHGGTKGVIIETGGTVKTPLFIKEGDKIEINTQTGEYVRRLT